MRPVSEKLLTAALVVETLDAVASKFIGDGNPLNVFVVADEHGHVETLSYDFSTAYRRWSTLVKGYRRVATLEDRIHGVLAGAEVITGDSPFGDRFDVYDDTERLGLR